MARIALPQMLERGYAKSLAAGAIASGGTLGMIVPPSVVMILYAILTENSIIALFLAAVIPGLLAVVFYIIAVAIVVSRHPKLAPVGPRRKLDRAPPNHAAELGGPVARVHCFRWHLLGHIYSQRGGFRRRLPSRCCLQSSGEG